MSCGNTLTGVKKPEQIEKFCCPYLEKLSKNNAIFDTIEINPRIVVFRYANKCVTYKETVEVTNKFDELRTFEVSWERPSSCIDMKIIGSTAVMPDDSFKMEIYLEPLYNNTLKDKRINIYLATEHPSLILEIPVIVVGITLDVSILPIIKMSKVPPNIKSSYAAVLYNPLRKSLNTKLSLQYIGPKSMDTLTLSCTSVTLKPFDYFIFYLKGYSPNYCALRTELYIRFNATEMKTIKVECEMVIYYPYLNNYFLKFGTVLLNCEQHRTIRICNETKEDLQVKWCRKKHISLSKKDSEMTLTTVEPDTKKLTDYLTIKPKKSYIPGRSSVFCTFTFSPKQSSADIGVDDSAEPPFPLLCSAYLATTTDHDFRVEVKLCGSLKGPDISIINTSIDLEIINLGELQVISVGAINNDEISGSIFFNRLESCVKARCTVKPHELLLQPGESKLFDVQYCTKDVGHFVDVLIFKVKFGPVIKVVLNGESRPFQIPIEPPEIDFDRIPICIVKKSSIVLTNPLSIPIMIYSKVCNDGTDTPLILDISDKLPPINISREWDIIDNNSMSSLSEFSYWIYDSKCRVGCESFLNLKDYDHIINNCSDWNLSQYSSCHSVLSEDNENLTFQETVLDEIPTYAKKLIKFIKCNNLHENPEGEIVVIQKILDHFVSIPYFTILKQKNYYKKANWDCMVTYPKEVIVEKYNYFLQPFESVEFRFLIVPNLAGKTVKEIHFKAIPIQTAIDEITQEDVDNKHFITKFQIKFNCKVPFIQADPNVIELDAYVDQNVEFLLKLSNKSKICGFANYKLIPSTVDGLITVSEENLKFFIKPNEVLEHKSVVKYFRTGEVTLQGLINIVGRQLPTTFLVFSDVKPPQIAFCPRKPTWEHEPLIDYSEKFFIENICPTKARFSLHLKNDKYIFCQPLGGILTPNQCVLIMFYCKHYDPGSYRYSLRIDVVHGCSYTIPIEITVKGYPIVPNPYIKDGIDMGNQFVSTIPYEININFKNYGKRSYKLIFKRTRKMNETTAKPIGFWFRKTVVTFEPEQEITNVLVITADEEGKMCTDFMIDVKLGDNRISKFFKFTACGTFLKPKIQWKPNTISMRIENFACSEGDNSIDKCLLKNLTPLPIEIELNIDGNFILFDNNEYKYGKKLVFLLNGNKERRLNVIFHESKCGADYKSGVYEGKIYCTANGINQRSLPVSALLLFPLIKLETNKLILYTDNLPAFTSKQLFNNGRMKAFYSIKEIKKTFFDADILFTENMLNTKSVSEIVDTEISQQFLIDPNYFLEYCCDYGTESEYSDDYSDDDVVIETKKSVADSELLADEKTEKIKKNVNNATESLAKTTTKKDKKNNKDRKSEKEKKEKTETNDKKDKDNKNKKLEPTKKDNFDTKGKKQDKETKSNKKKEPKNAKPIEIEIPKIEIPLPSVQFEDVFKSIALFLNKKNNISNQTLPKRKEKIIPFEKCVRDSIKNGPIHLNPLEDEIEEISSRSLNVFFEEEEPIYTVNAIKSDYEISSVGGNKGNLSIYVYNFRGRVELAPSTFDLGTKPWYKVFRKNVQILNANNIQFQIRILSDPYLNENLKFLNGFFEILTDEKFVLKEKSSSLMKFITSLGFQYYFKKQIGIVVNSITTTVVQLTGSGQLPMLWILNLPRYETTKNRQMEYSSLNYIYNYEIDNQVVHESPYETSDVEQLNEYLTTFNKSNESLKTLKIANIRKSKNNILKPVEEIFYTSTSSESDDEAEFKRSKKSIIPFIGDGLELETTKLNTEYLAKEIMENFNESYTSIKNYKIKKPHSKRYTYEKDAKIIQKPKRTVRKYKANLIQDNDENLDDFVVIDYPKQYPTIFQIESMFETLNFLFYISTFKEMSKAFSILCGNTQEKHVNKIKKPIAHKLFIVRPLPYQVSSYILDLGQIVLNENYKFDLDLLLSIPEDIILSARTLTFIPGFCANFVYDGSEPKILVYQSTPLYSGVKRYMNLTERKAMSNPNCESCPKHATTGAYTNCDIKVCHAHSYDIDLRMVHRRELDTRARSAIYNYYTRLNQKFKEHKNPYILSELYQNDNQTLTKKLLIKLKIDFLACDCYFANGQLFEDYLYIDIHLGPSIPIYIKGVFSTN